MTPETGLRIPVVPSYWFVGFSGHRQITDPPAILSALRQELGKLHGRAPSQLIGVCSLAAGADQLFLSACMAESIPYQLFFPFPVEEFKKDYADPDWPGAQQFLNTAIHHREGNAGNKRPDGYRVCGIEIVDESDIFLVVWDGRQAAGVGGTEELVTYARSIQKPLIWIHAETFEIRTENVDESLFDDKATSELERLLDPKRQDGELQPADPLKAIAHLMEKADAYATRTAPAVRTMVVSVIIVNLVIVAFGAISSIAGIWKGSTAQTTENIFNIIRFALVILVFAVALSKITRTRHDYWLHSRYVAEMCRSIMATWVMEIRAPYLLPGTPHELAHIGRTLEFLRSLGQTMPKADRRKTAEEYVKTRIEDQIGYYTDKSKNLLPQRRSLNFISIVGLALSGLLMLGLIVESVMEHWIKPGSVAATGIALAPTSHDIINGIMTQLLGLTPVIATTALSLIYVYEIQRRLVHNQRLNHILTHRKAQILSAPTAAALELHVTYCEQALLGEVQDWYYYNLYGK
jgi:hypothetical protein